CSMCAVTTGDSGEPGGDVGMADLSKGPRVQRTEVGPGEVELGDPVGGGAQSALLGREVDVDDLAEAALGFHPLRRLCALRVLSERNPREDFARPLTGLRWAQSFGAANGDALGASPTSSAALVNAETQEIQASAAQTISCGDTDFNPPLTTERANRISQPAKSSRPCGDNRDCRSTARSDAPPWPLAHGVRAFPDGTDHRLAGGAGQTQ